MNVLNQFAILSLNVPEQKNKQIKKFNRQPCKFEDFPLSHSLCANNCVAKKTFGYWTLAIDFKFHHSFYSSFEELSK